MPSSTNVRGEHTASSTTFSNDSPVYRTPPAYSAIFPTDDSRESAIASIASSNIPLNISSAPIGRNEAPPAYSATFNGGNTATLTSVRNDAPPAYSATFNGRAVPPLALSTTRPPVPLTASLPTSPPTTPSVEFLTLPESSGIEYDTSSIESFDIPSERPFVALPSYSNCLLHPESSEHDDTRNARWKDILMLVEGYTNEAVRKFSRQLGLGTSIATENYMTEFKKFLVKRNVEYNINRTEPFSVSESEHLRKLAYEFSMSRLLTRAYSMFTLAKSRITIGESVPLSVRSLYLTNCLNGLNIDTLQGISPDAKEILLEMKEGNFGSNASWVRNGAQFNSVKINQLCKELAQAFFTKRENIIPLGASLHEVWKNSVLFERGERSLEISSKNVRLLVAAFFILSLASAGVFYLAAPFFLSGVIVTAAIIVSTIASVVFVALGTFGVHELRDRGALNPFSSPDITKEKKQLLLLAGRTVREEEASSSGRKLRWSVAIFNVKPTLFKSWFKGNKLEKEFSQIDISSFKKAILTDNQDNPKARRQLAEIETQEIGSPPPYQLHSSQVERASVPRVEVIEGQGFLSASASNSNEDTEELSNRRVASMNNIAGNRTEEGGGHGQISRRGYHPTGIVRSNSEGDGYNRGTRSIRGARGGGRRNFGRQTSAVESSTRENAQQNRGYNL